MFTSFGSSINYQKHFGILAKLYKVLGWLTVLVTIIVTGVAVHEIIKYNIKLEGGAATYYLIFAGIIIVLSLAAFINFKFAKGIESNSKWATGFLGYLLGLMSLPSFPIGTAIGAYTIWVLVQYEKQK